MRKGVHGGAECAPARRSAASFSRARLALRALGSRARCPPTTLVAPVPFVPCNPRGLVLLRELLLGPARAAVLLAESRAAAGHVIELGLHMRHLACEESTGRTSKHMRTHDFRQ